MKGIKMPISRFNNTVNSNSISPETLTSKLLYVSYSEYNHDWLSLLHTHKFSEMFYVINGKGKFQVEQEYYEITKDDFLIVNPNVLHTEYSDPDFPLEYIIIGVENLSFTFSQKKDHTVFHCTNQQKELLYFMNSMMYELQKKEVQYEEVCQHMLDVLIIKLMRIANFTFQITSSSKINHECLKLKQYMDSCYSQDITLDSLASISHLNKYYLSHVFKQYFGCSPINYLCQVRLNAAQELLESTDYSISDIAQICGFSSQSYFAQSFLKCFKETPRSYRNRKQK